MLGILDSGSGGENTARELRRHRPDADIALYLDREHAPYGERSEEELIRLVEDGILSLRASGAEPILLACCTASSVYEKLSPEARAISLPIIESVAKAALEMAEGERIALLATERTVASGEFGRYLGKDLIASIPSGKLVRLIDGGACDGRADEALQDYLVDLLAPLKDSEVGVLILGCTHFSSLAGEISTALGKIIKNKILIADSAKIAAETLISSGVVLSGVGREMRL